MATAYQDDDDTLVADPNFVAHSDPMTAYSEHTVDGLGAEPGMNVVREDFYQAPTPVGETLTGPDGQRVKTLPADNHGLKIGSD
jgi:hypothetical protein